MNWIYLSGMSSGTADINESESALPGEKKSDEVFWVTQIIPHIEEFRGKKVSVHSNKDDSHGQHDVIIHVNSSEIGIQVTELTIQSIASLSNQRIRILRNLLNFFHQNKLPCEKKFIIKFFISRLPNGKFIPIKPEKIFNDLKNAIDNINNKDRTLIFEFGKVLIKPINNEEKIFTPSVENIGIDVDFGPIEVNEQIYKAAINDILFKKSKSKSPWLIIWSTEFYIYKDLIGDGIIDYMRLIFSSSQFEQVFFMESIDIEEMFIVNLSVVKIK